MAMVLAVPLLDHVRHGYRPPTAIILSDPIEHWRMQDTGPGRNDRAGHGHVLVWLRALLRKRRLLRFSSAMLVADSPSPVCWLVIDTGAISGIDYTAGNMLRDLQQDLRDKALCSV